MRRIKKFFNSERPLKWLFYGDSITHGAFHTFGARDYSEHFSERVRFEMARRQDIVLKSAFSGDTTEKLLGDFEWRVTRFTPDVVFLMIGMNDACSTNKINETQFKDNLLKLNARITDFGGICVMMTTCPIIPGGDPRREPYIDGFMQQIHDVATEQSLPLIDHYSLWKDNNNFLYWMSNAFHPNAHGHLAFSTLIFRELGIWSEDSNVCKLFFPGRTELIAH